MINQKKDIKAKKHSTSSERWKILTSNLNFDII